ncbi:acyl carrier protein [Gordonia sp. NPDC003424]
MTGRAPTYDELVDWLTAKVAGYLGVPSAGVGVDVPLADLGIDSVSGMALCADLNDERGFDVETTVVWDYATIEAIATHLMGRRGSA